VQLAPTHMGTIRFKFGAGSNEDAHRKVKQLAALLERNDVRVSHKTASTL
jgi:hypothetical protein